MRNVFCESCRTGPRGIEGHEQIQEHAMSPPQGGKDVVVFVCELCRTGWARHYEGSGVFVWEPLATDPQMQLD